MEITSRQELAKALRSAKAADRQTVLEALNRAFDQALEFGRPINQEALDELYLCYSENGPDRTWYAYLLLRLTNKYNLEVARQEFLCAKNSKLLLLAASHLARLPAEERIVFLSPLVLDAGNAARCRAAANMLDDCFERLNPAVALRAALISDHNLPLPALNADTLGIWLIELQGPYPKSAERALLQLGNEALEFLLEAWQELPLAVRVWLMNKTTERKLAAVVPQIRDTLCPEQNRELLLTALGCVKLLQLEEDVPAALYDHNDPAIRAAAVAVAAGNAKLDWPARFAAEGAEKVRLAILERLKWSAESSDVEFLISCLADDSWRVRAQATEALVALASASLEPLRSALGSADERVKVAAAKALYRLGKEDWIRTELQFPVVDPG